MTEIKKYWRAAMLLLLSLTGAATLAGCTQGSPVMAPGSLGAPGVGSEWLQDRIKAYLDSDLGDFERDVLERAASTGIIASEDYEEAVTRYLKCAKDHGFTIDTVKQANGIYQWLPQDVDSNRIEAYMDSTYQCADGTTMIIEGLYKAQVANPDGEDTPTAAVRCFAKYGVADAAYTSDDFTKDYNDGFKDSKIDIKDPNVVMCLTSLGFGISSGD